MLFPTTKKENRKSRFTRYFFNFVPCYRGSRGWVMFIADDFKEVHVKLKLNFFTRNYVGTVFGGSMYASLDPLYMLMLIHILGDDYIVWDKAATIRFVRPATTHLKARFAIDDNTIALIQSNIKENHEMDMNFQVQYLDRNGKTTAEVTKILYIADKKFYEEKRKSKGQSTEYKKML